MPMTTILELVDERRLKTRRQTDIANKAKDDNDRLFTPDEKAELADLDREIKELSGAIEERQAHEKQLAAIHANEEMLAKPLDDDDAIPATRMDPRRHQQRRVRKPYRRDFKLKAFVNPDGTPDEEGAFRSAMWLYASLGNVEAHRWCQRNGIDVNTRAMSEHINTAGGALVPDELSQRIIDLREEYGVFRREAYPEPMGSDVKNVTRQTGGTTAYFVGEGDDHTESDMALDTIKLVAKKLAVATRISAELDEDSAISVVDRFAMDAAKALALKEDQCGFNGDGTQTYAGIHGICNKIEANSSFAGVYAPSGIDYASEVTLAHIAQVMGMLPGYVTNPKFYMSSQIFYGVFRARAIAAGGNTIATLEEGGSQRRFLGAPVEFVQVMVSSLAATGTPLNTKCVFMFGDLSMAATIGNRRGITASRSDEKYWSSDEIALKVTERFDMNVHDIGDASNAGPIVALYGSS